MIVARFETVMLSFDQVCSASKSLLVVSDVLCNSTKVLELYVNEEFLWLIADG